MWLVQPEFLFLWFERKIMENCYLLLGGNTGKRRQQLEAALEAIGKEIGEIKRLSSWYESASWGFESEHAFLNVVAEVKTGLSPINVLNTLLSIEQQLGRIRSKERGYADRPVDLDVLLYADRIVDLPELTVPHPRMHERRFTLKPLCDLVPEKKHPTIGTTFKSLLQVCPDTIEPVLLP